MKMEFNSNNFSSSMHINQDTPQQEASVCDVSVVDSVKSRFVLLPAAIAFIGALLQLPYTCLSLLWADFFVVSLGLQSARFAVTTITIHVVLATLTVTAAIITLSTRRNEPETRSSRIARILSIISLVLCGLAFVANIVCTALLIL